MLLVLRKLWLWCLILALLIAASVWTARPREQLNLLYQADGYWRFKGKNKYIGQYPTGRYVSISLGAGFTNDGNWFRVVGSELQLGAFPNDPPNTVLALPEELLISRSWSVVASADGQRIVCVTERGLAVWRSTPPHDLIHSWTITTEPLAGPKAEHHADFDTPFAPHELELAYSASPDGRLACVYAVEQLGGSEERRRHDGIVIVRDLETGQELAQLVHPKCGPVIERVAWSNDCRCLATFAPRTGQVTVWDVTNGESIGLVKESADEQLALSHDGSLVYTVSRWAQRIVVHRVADGTRVGSRKILCTQVVLSPDGKYLAASTDTDVQLIQSSTLETVWSSPGGMYQYITFRDNGAEFAALRVDISGLMARAHVKAWNTAAGFVILDAGTSAYSGTTNGVGFGRDDAIWTYGPYGLSRFKHVQ